MAFLVAIISQPDNGFLDILNATKATPAINIHVSIHLRSYILTTYAYSNKSENRCLGRLYCWLGLSSFLINTSNTAKAFSTTKCTCQQYTHTVDSLKIRQK